MISLVLTCLNENESLKKMVGDVWAQTVKPDEFIIVDGGSTDGTIAEDLVITRVIVDPTCNIKHTPSPVAKGRNRAIREAKGDTIVVTDAGCRLDPNFIAEMTREVDYSTVVFGKTVVVAETDLERVSQVILGSQKYSSRAIAFKKATWETVGGYPEVSLTAEDTLFNEKLKGYRFVHADAVVYWKPRGRVKDLIRMCYRFSKGDAISGLRVKMHLVKLLKWGLCALIASLCF